MLSILLSERADVWHPVGRLGRDAGSVPGQDGREWLRVERRGIRDLVAEHRVEHGCAGQPDENSASQLVVILLLVPGLEVKQLGGK